MTVLDPKKKEPGNSKGKSGDVDRGSIEVDLRHAFLRFSNEQVQL